MKALHEQERPRERCLLYGAHTLSLRECLAILIGTGPKNIGCMGVAKQILGPFSGLSAQDEERIFFSNLELSGATALRGIKGLGVAGRTRVLAAFEIGRRYATFRTTRGKPDEVFSGFRAQALKKITPERRSAANEWIGFVAVLRTQELTDLCVIETGARTHVNVDPIEFFARLLSFRPKAFFLFHNHPSGNMSPSQEDVELTRAIARIAEQLEIELLEHWIVSPQTHSRVIY